MARAVAAAVLAISAAANAPARATEEPAEGDVRDLKVGMTAADLPERGYVALACAADGARLAGWAEFARCPPGSGGLREVTFEFDESLQEWAAVNDAYEGTKIAGHPVRLALLFDEAGSVAAIRAVTTARALYLRKKAFLLGVRVMGRYGRDGWRCVDRAPVAGRQKLGGMYLDRHCEKDLADRRILLDTRLYRDVGQAGDQFTSGTTFEVRRLSG